MRFPFRLSTLPSALAVLLLGACAATPPPSGPAWRASGPPPIEAPFDAMKLPNPARLAAFLRAMPKGADQNIDNLALMTSPGMSAARKLGRRVGWTDDADHFLAKLRQNGLDEITRDDGAGLAAVDAASRTLMGCAGASAPPGCGVTVRYLAQVIRTVPREQVFAAIAPGFVLASQPQQVGGTHLVAPEVDRISLTSRDVILGVAGRNHPFETDDEGVSRIDLSHEYPRAVTANAMGYAEIKHLSRNGLTHAFVGGHSLWQDAARALPVTARSADTPGVPAPSADCAAFLRSSAQARLQWALEAACRRFGPATLTAAR